MLIGFKKWELAQIRSDVAFSNYVVKINLTLVFGDITSNNNQILNYHETIKKVLRNCNDKFLWTHPVIMSERKSFE